MFTFMVDVILQSKQQTNIKYCSFLVQNKIVAKPKIVVRLEMSESGLLMV